MKHTLTHGTKSESTHEGITRTFSLQRYIDENYDETFLVLITTTGLYEEPQVTKLTLTAMGYDLFCMFMRHAPQELFKYPS